jgi:integrase
LFDRDLIALPKNVANDKALKIKLEQTTPQPFPLKEIKTLLNDADTPEKTKLFVLIALNTGAYPSDLADLQAEEIDLKNGRITRKRSKTKDHPNVPKVSYKLWPQTLALLRKHSQKKGVALLNEDGKPLQSKYVDEEGKAVKICNVTCAFRRTALRLKLTGNLAGLRKSSANLIFNNPEFETLHTLFLGHSVRTVAEQSYVTREPKALDKAIDWLGQQYGIDSLTRPTARKQSAPRRGRPAKAKPVTGDSQ